MARDPQHPQAQSAGVCPTDRISDRPADDAAETITRDTFRTLNRIRDLGCDVGLVLNPGTPLNQVGDYLSRVVYSP